MLGIALGVVAVLVAAGSTAGYYGLVYQEGEHDYNGQKYENKHRGSVARAYDRGWDAAQRETFRMISNAQRKLEEG